MKIRNTHGEVISIECDKCNNPVEKDKDGYYLGTIVVKLTSMEDTHYCIGCAEHMKRMMGK